MKRSVKEERLWAIRQLVAGSAAARRINERPAEIEAQLRARPRRVWPTATVARMLGISRALLRKWVGQGLLVPFERPSEQHRPGFTERGVREFLANLAEAGDGRIWVRPRGRPQPAEARCREAGCHLADGEEYSPAEFAARAGVSVTTVMRMLACGELEAWYPTPHRPKICNWQQKERKKRLTRKMGKTAR